jgi:hypothetical protein
VNDPELVMPQIAAFEESPDGRQLRHPPDKDPGKRREPRRNRERRLPRMAFARGRGTPGRANQRGALGWSQVEGINQPARGFALGIGTDAAFEVANAAGANSRPLGQALLREAGSDTVPPQQVPKAGCVGRRGAAHPFTCGDALRVAITPRSGGRF